jgi:hypothetical protein
VDGADMTLAQRHVAGQRRLGGVQGVFNLSAVKDYHAAIQLPYLHLSYYFFINVYFMS